MLNKHEWNYNWHDFQIRLFLVCWTKGWLLGQLSVPIFSAALELITCVALVWADTHTHTYTLNHIQWSTHVHISGVNLWVFSCHCDTFWNPFNSFFRFKPGVIFRVHLWKCCSLSWVSAEVSGNSASQPELHMRFLFFSFCCLNAENCFLCDYAREAKLWWWHLGEVRPDWSYAAVWASSCGAPRPKPGIFSGGTSGSEDWQVS